MAYKYEISKDSIFGYYLYSNQKIDGNEFLRLCIDAYKETSFNAQDIVEYISKNDKRFVKIISSGTKLKQGAKIIMIDDHDIISFVNVDTIYSNTIGMC